jgi:tetratricopeptide (TPR) repeat protein
MLFAVNYLRGEALRQMEQYAEALDPLGRAFAENPEDVGLLMAMAWCYKRTDQLSKAISAMEQAYRISPKQAVILYNLACYWSLAGNKTQSLSWLGRALRMDRSLRRLSGSLPVALTECSSPLVSRSLASESSNSWPDTNSRCWPVTRFSIRPASAPRFASPRIFNTYARRLGYLGLESRGIAGVASKTRRQRSRIPSPSGK